MRYAFHRDALAEYHDAAVYYSEISPTLGARFVEAVEHAIASIIEAPKQYRDIDSGIRRCLTRVFPYSILYSIESEYILIVAIMHCSREPHYWKQRAPR